MKKDKKSGGSKDKDISTSNPTDRDFQRTEEDIDSVSQSEKEELNRRTKKANTKPTKDKMS